MADSRSVDNQSGGQPGRQAETRAGGPTTGSQQSPVSPNVEADYWRTNYQHRPYVEPGVDYDQYAPAYRYGWEMYTVHSGRSFEDMEPELSRRWDTSRQGSRLTWERAKEAVRDAWNRMAGHRSGAASTTAAQTPEKESEVTSQLNKLVHICMDGVKGFRDAAEKIGPPYADPFLRFAAEREQLAGELRRAANARGGDPEKKGDSLGAVHRGWIDLKSALGGGPKAILNECERGEDAAVKAFQDAINTQSLPPDIETMLNRQYTKVKNVHDQVRDMRNAAK
jgi:uncharacterized protein (TIGR02284 family)